MQRTVHVSLLRALLLLVLGGAVLSGQGRAETHDHSVQQGKAMVFPEAEPSDEEGGGEPSEDDSILPDDDGDSDSGLDDGDDEGGGGDEQFATDVIETEFFPWYELVEIDVSGFPEPVFLPFVEGAATDIPRDVRNDYWPEDGWELVYNFLTTNPGPGPFFAIYNKYRGILRFFYLHNKVQTYSHLTFGLQIDAPASGTSLLNTQGEFARADDAKMSDPWVMVPNGERFGTSGPAFEHWNYFDVEVTYDPTIEQLTHEELGMFLFAKGHDVYDVSINGKQQGTFEGTLQFSGSSSPAVSIGSLTFEQSNISQSNIGGGGAQATSGAATDEQSFLGQVGDKIKAQVIDEAKSRLESLVGDLAAGALDFLGSPITSIFKSFLGGGSGAPDNGVISARIDTRLELDGTIELQQKILDRSLKVPGSSISDMSSQQRPVIVPHYDEPLGLFNLVNTPVLRFSESFSEPTGFGSLGTVSQDYSLGSDATALLVNPAIADLIEILEVQSRILYYTSYAGPTPGVGSFLYSHRLRNQGHELIDSDPDFTLYFGGERSVHFRFTEREPFGDWRRRVHNGLVFEIIVHYRRIDTGEDLFWAKTYLPEFVGPS